MATHAAWPVRLLVVVPLAHGLQLVWPAVAANVLTAHLAQVTEPTRLEKEPAGQGLAALRPTTLQYEPARQGTHEAADFTEL